jgi:hypothetical protein
MWKRRKIQKASLLNESISIHEKSTLATIYVILRSFLNVFLSPPLSLSLANSGFDGGQRQWFIMEIFDQQTNMLQANISSKYPVFTVNGLDSGKLLKIIIYAINVKGRSDSVLLEAFTLKAAEKQTGKLSFCALAGRCCVCV